MATKASPKKTYVVEETYADDLICRSCGVVTPLSDFRLFQTSPEQVHMDFCVHCEQKHGTTALYRRFNAYGTAEIVKAVFTAERTPDIRKTPEQVRLLVQSKSDRAPETNEEVIKRELQRRELARRRLIYFTTAFHPAYKPGWMHQDICRRLERFVQQIEAGASPRLMICMPPRSGKSALASDAFPSWVLGKHPEWPIIASSYAQSLPLEFSRNIRDRLTDPEYMSIFPNSRLRADAKGIEAWKTIAGGGYIAAGVGTGITGKGFMLGILDDPIKDQEAADSEQIRNATYKWYQSVFRTRVAPGGGILIINTRWHWHDPSGLLLDQDAELAKSGVPLEERENWEVVSYPAIAEADEYLMRDGTIGRDVPPEVQDQALRLLRKKGEALHPERYPINELKKLKNSLSASIWSALYQQQPTPDEGDFFKKDDFQFRWLDPAYRPLCTVFMTVDYAIGKKQRNDFTVAAVFALDAEDNLYVLEIRRGRWGTTEIADNVAALVERHKPDIYAGEQGSIHMAVWPVIKQALDARRLYITVDETLTPIQDKEARARPLQGRMQRHKLFFSYDEATRPEIYDITEREMLQFPNGVNDDIVDVLAWGSRLALNISLPNAQTPVQRQKGWKDKLVATTAARSSMAA